MNCSRQEVGKAKLGILALQGDFHAHGRVLEGLGAPWRKVLWPEDLDGLRGLVIPGGESTTLMKLLDADFTDKIRVLAERGGVIYGTCAGAILLARKVLNPEQPSLGLLDAVIIRNGYGRQVQSAVWRKEDEAVEGEDLPSELIFIRAPRFQEVGSGVRVLGRVKGAPVFVQQERIMATTFHPELTDDPSVHLRFLRMVEEA